VEVVITRFVAEHQPNIVEYQLTDIHGREWVFEGKDVYVTAEYLERDSDYPRPGELDCTVVQMLFDETGEKFYRIDTSPEETLDEVNIFDVRSVKPISL
jgi:hypothetical protein